MKVAVSIPDHTFANADALAKRLGTSRSDLYTRALDAFIDTNGEHPITAAMNRVLAEVGPEPEDDKWLQAATKQVLDRTEW